MADFVVTDKTLLTSVDRSADSFLIYDANAAALKRTTVNYGLDLTSHPVGIDDTQTLTAKTITAPTISSPVLSGTVTGTYTIGGTPTFPSAVATLTGSQALTNKTLTSPTINTATISNPTLTVDTVSEHTAANGVTIDGLNIKDSKLNTNDSVVTANITDSAITSPKVATGMPVQIVNTISTAIATSTVIIPQDDTIPQITEGFEVMTLAITPKSATNILVISTTVYGGSNVGDDLIAAIFQDTTANALAAVGVPIAANGGSTVPLTHTMTAGTTSSTTFRVRFGGSQAGTRTFNGRVGVRVFGAITKSSIVITEYKA